MSAFQNELRGALNELSIIGLKLLQEKLKSFAQLVRHEWFGCDPGFDSLPVMRRSLIIGYLTRIFIQN